MLKRKVDGRVRALIETSVKAHHRSFFVIVGDHGKDQVVNLHYILSKAQFKSKPSALWCYKKSLGFSTHRKKRIKQVKKQLQRGLYNPDTEDPFELFISSTHIRWCYYKDTQNVLGSTYGMLILQDFEALTPNLLARTIETVEGGGVIILLLRTMESLKKLYTMTMDIHARFRTEAFGDIIPRFNERFLLSLGELNNCLVVDDQLNILPISRHRKKVEMPNGRSDESDELRHLKANLCERQPIGCLVDAAKTIDQAKSIVKFVSAISEKGLRTTVSLTADRGRGKSAALGIAIAAAIAYDYSNIFITSPSPENLITLFQFILKGFDALKLKEHLDYEVIRNSNSKLGDTIVRLNVFRNHRQTIQYIDPHDSKMLSQAELLVIDEAAAIPLPIVKNLLGDYLVFMSSTTNGYEGTGRSLSHKLIAQLRKHQHSSALSADNTKAPTGRRLVEITLKTPIRYSLNDPIESWLNRILCLDTSNSSNRLVCGSPHPSKCELFHVNRNALFSYHKVSETFLQRIMSLFVSSHYKNSPNDLQMLCDAPAHEIFVLLGPNPGRDGALPDILCAVQICKEGKISESSAQASLARGKSSPGDLIPWCVSQQFLDENFASLSGARIVRIATHPDVIGMGYGTRAIDLLVRYFGGKITQLNASSTKSPTSSTGNGVTSRDKNPRMPSLLTPLTHRSNERLHYLGVSYGVTAKLFNFWRKNDFSPVYIRQTVNSLTGEHTCIMIHPFDVSGLESGWIDSFTSDFGRRFLKLSGSVFRKLDMHLAIAIVSKCCLSFKKKNKIVTQTEMGSFFSQVDFQRLRAYSRNMADYHIVADLLPAIAMMYFQQQLKESFKLSTLQTMLFLGVGIQRRSIGNIALLLRLPSSQLLAMFNKSIRKFVSYLGEAEFLTRQLRGKALNETDGKFTEKVSLLGNDKKYAKPTPKKVINKDSSMITKLKGKQFEVIAENREVDRHSKKKKKRKQIEVIAENEVDRHSKKKKKRKQKKTPEI
jgi:N-acetyltransferase 10